MWYMDSEGYIRSKLNVNKCLDVGDKVNKQAYIWQCGGKLWQRWEVMSDGRIRNKAYPDKYLGVSNGCNNGVAEGRRPEPQSISTSGSCARQQQWVHFTASYRAFHNAVNRDLFMDLSGGNTHNGNSVLLWDCDHGSNQMFYMDSDGRIRSKANDKKCLEAGANVDLWAKLVVWDCQDEIQKFELTPEGKLRSKKNGRFIGVSGGCGGVAKGAKLEMQDEFAGADMCSVQQQWV
jgi:hypothetical protein